MANGLFAGGSGTSTDPFLIEDAHDLNAIRNGLNKHYKLIKDIDLNVAPYNEGEGWGWNLSVTAPFTGVFDGEGHSINNMYISTSENRSLLPHLYNGGVARNFNVRNAFKEILTGSISGGNGIVTPYVRYSSLLENVKVEGVISDRAGSTSRSAGVSGVVRDGGVIKNCIVDVKIDRHNDSYPFYFGGIVGELEVNGKLENSIFIGQTYNASGVIGDGAVGYKPSNKGEIIKSFTDKDKFGKNDTHLQSISTLEAKTAQTFIDAGWHEEMNEDGSPVWILEDGEYPKLWFEVEPSLKKYLIRSNNVIFTIENEEVVPTNLTEPLKREDFNEHGFESVSLLIGKNFENARLLINSPINESVSNIIVGAFPKPQLILPKGDIVSKSVISRIVGFNITSLESNKGKIRIVFSVDEGEIWQGYDLHSERFVEVEIENMNDVSTNGMTPSVFNSLMDRWNEVFVDRIRFGYYLEIEDEQDRAEVDELEATIEVLGAWESTVHEVDYDYEYDNTKIYVSLLKDGSYKINYME